MREGFTIHHNGPAARCIGQPHARCVAFWGAVVAYHTSSPPKGKGWSGVAYSFGVCPHGQRFTGQGWNRRQFANGADLVGADDGNDASWYTILAFVGGGPGTGFPEEIPTPEMIAGVAALIEEGRRTVCCGSRVLPHNAFKRKACPGPTFVALAQRWNDQPISTPTTTPVQEDPDMAFTDDHATKLDELHAALTSGRVARQVWAHDVASLPTNSGAAADYMRKIRIAAEGEDIDEAEVARLVLLGLPAADIAAAIPQELAGQVADELAGRLTS